MAVVEEEKKIISKGIQHLEKLWKRGNLRSGGRSGSCGWDLSRGAAPEGSPGKDNSHSWQCWCEGKNRAGKSRENPVTDVIHEIAEFPKNWENWGPELSL